MSDVLFIKTSSLGDVIHHMPAMTEVRRHRPDARISWVVEEAFAPLVRLHAAVDAVIPVDSRRWRRGLHRLATWRELKDFVVVLRARSYDEIVDTQGLVRTAVIARLARGRRHGYDAQSVREPPASRFYDVRHRVDQRPARDRAQSVADRAGIGLRARRHPRFRPRPGALWPAGAAPPTASCCMPPRGTPRNGRSNPGSRPARMLSGRGVELLLPWGTRAGAGSQRANCGGARPMRASPSAGRSMRSPG